VDKYFASLETYLGKFYTDWKDETTLNTKSVEKEFRARAKANKDKRFKKEAEIQAGIKKDIKRIEKYRDALEKTYGYLDLGVISFAKASYTSADGSYTISEKNYGLNLCPNTATMGGLSKEFAYYGTRDKIDENGAPVLDSEGKPVTEQYITAENMTLVFLNMSGVENGFQYESLLYAVYLIDSYYTPQA
jgi:hypothetical protein